MEKRKVALITGITGQDGSYLAELLLSKGYDVHGTIRRSSTDYRERIAHLEGTPNFHLHYADLGDSMSIIQVMNKVKPTEVYNLAAQSHVQVSFDSPEFTADVDATGVLRILEAIRQCGLEKTCRMYQASTSELYGKVEEVPQNENTPFHPYSPYAVAKQYGFWIVKEYREAYNMFCCSGILFNHESERRGETFVTRKITLAAARIKQGKQSKLYLGNLDSLRDWGYAKFETFPIWNLPLKHPVNLAYEAATADLNDVNMIDPFHLEAYGVTTVNYNRDIEIFPVVNAMFELIAGKSPYKSPTDMGVNMAGNCIVDDEACREASRNEIIRRYFKALCDLKTGKNVDSEIFKLELLLNQAGLAVGDRAVEKQAHAVAERTGGAPAAAIELPDGTVVTGKNGPLLGAASSALLNALKKLAGIDHEIDLVSARAIEPIQTLKTNYLGSRNPRLHTDEILIALSSSAAENETAAVALQQLSKLKGCDMHSTVILSSVDMDTIKRLGMYLTCDPAYEQEDRKYHKK